MTTALVSLLGLMVAIALDPMSHSKAAARIRLAVVIVNGNNEIMEDT